MGHARRRMKKLIEEYQRQKLLTQANKVQETKEIKKVKIKFVNI